MSKAQAKRIRNRLDGEMEPNPRAERYARAVAKLDKDDALNLRFGGDGDAGEYLIALLSEVLDLEEGKFQP